MAPVQREGPDPGRGAAIIVAVAAAGGLRRLAVVATGLTLAVGLGACDALPGGRDARPGGVSREGPAAAWTATVATGDHQIAVQGDVVVVSDERALLGLDLASGRERWRRGTDAKYTMTVAGASIVQATKDGPLEVLDPATGATRWRDDRTGWSHTIFQDTVYADDCTSRAAGGDGAAGCTVEAHEVADGRTRWTLAATSGVRGDAIGSRTPYAPASGPYVLAGTARGGRVYGAVDVRTGRPAAGTVEGKGWYALTAGKVLVSTQNDPPSGDKRCTVGVTSVAADTGAALWAGEVFSGRRSDGGCEKTLANPETGILIGTGSRVAASTSAGRPQVVDLATGGTVWTGDAQGTPVDGDATSLLVRQSADEGPLTLLDAGSGKVRWSAPDPGLSGQSASWSSAVTRRLVAVTGSTDEHPFVLVYAVDGGRKLGKFPSWLAGAGEDWVAVTHGDSSGRKLVLEFVRM